MAKLFTPTTKIQNKQSQEEKEKSSSPSESTINALLNFSKSLSIPKSASIGKMFVVGN
jgi:hypothetical protein